MAWHWKPAINVNVCRVSLAAFLLTDMTKTNKNLHAWMSPRASKLINTQTNYFCTYFSWGYQLNSIKPITHNHIIWFLRRVISLVQAPRLICLRVDLLALGVIHACEWDDWHPPKLLFCLDCFCAEACVKGFKAFSSPEAALLLVSTKNHDLWSAPTTFRFWMALKAQ